MDQLEQIRLQKEALHQLLSAVMQKTSGFFKIDSPLHKAVKQAEKILIL